MSLSLSRGPRLVRSISTTAVRAKKLGVPDKQERDRYKQEQEKKQKERLLAAKQARDRGEDWSGDSGYDPDATRIILDRKAGPHVCLFETHSSRLYAQTIDSTSTNGLRI